MFLSPLTLQARASSKLAARKDRRRKQQEINTALQEAFDRAQAIRKYLRQQVAMHQARQTPFPATFFFLSSCCPLSCRRLGA